MAGRFRKGLWRSFLLLGTAFGIYTGIAVTKACDYDERTATVTYGQLQDIVADDNPIITHLDISLLRGKQDFEKFIKIALGDDVDFSEEQLRFPARFDRALRDQVGLHYEAERQEGECTNDLCYPPPSTVEDMIILAARITRENLDYDYKAHFIYHTEHAFDNDHILGGIVEFVIRSVEAGVEYVNVSSMAPDEVLNYGQGACEQYTDVFNAVLSRINGLFGSPYDLSVGTITSRFGSPRSESYEGLVRLLNLYYFHQNSDYVPHISSIVIAHDPYRLENPHIYFVDSQLDDPFIDEDQIINIDRDLFSEFNSALTLAEEYSVCTYSRRYNVDCRGVPWDHIVIDDRSARILVEDLGVREDIVRYIRDHMDQEILTLSEIMALQRYEGEADMEGLITYFDGTGWLVYRLQEHCRGGT